MKRCIYLRSLLFLIVLNYHSGRNSPNWLCDGHYSDFAEETPRKAIKHLVPMEKFWNNFRLRGTLKKE